MPPALSTAAPRGPGAPPHPTLTHPGRKTCSVPPTTSTRNHSSSSSLGLNMARACGWNDLLLRGAWSTRHTP